MNLIIQIAVVTALLLVNLLSTSALAQAEINTYSRSESMQTSRAPLVMRQDFSLMFNTGGNRIEARTNASLGSSMVASGGAAPYTYRVIAGRLPSGISLDANGTFAGRASTSGSYRFVVRAEDANQRLSVSEFFVSIQPAQIFGQLRSLRITSSTTGKDLPFSIYLPPGYTNSGRRYPVIYHLHGIGGTHNGPHLQSVARSFETSLRNGLIEEVIIVFPDGFHDSFWADSVDGVKPAEIHLAQDLISYIDNNYASVATRETRIIQGYSMGGFGAAKFASKYPQLFSACVIYDGALLSWQELVRHPRHVQQVEQIFGNSEQVFDQYSPWYWLIQNAETLRLAMKFRSNVGVLQAYNRNWRTALLAGNQSLEYVETGLPHNLEQLLNAQGANSWLFIGQHLSQR